MMDLDQLQSVRDRERQTDKLQQLRESFYADAAEMIQDLRERRDGAAAEADDPFDDPTVGRLSDRIDTAERTVQAIYEKRVGKIVKAASFAAADLPAESEGMTAEEQALFETLVDDIRANRQRVLDVLSGDDVADRSREGPDGLSGDDAPAPPEDDDAVDAADVMGSDGSEPPTPPEQSPADGDDGADPRRVDDSTASDTEDGPRADGAGGAVAGDATSATVEEAAGGTGDEREAVPRTTVRITDDVGEVFGVDEREYHLAAEDVVTLPAANAEPLLDRGAAERID